jgi:CRISPR-associated protein Csd1
MILKALVELAERDGLMDDLDYQPMPVRWVVVIDAGGRMVGEIADTQRPPADGEGRPSTAVHSVPNRSPRTAQDACEFVVEKPEYVFGHFDESWVKDKTEAGRLEKIEARRMRAPRRGSLYRAEVRLAAERTGDAALKALASFLERPPPDMPAGLGEGDLIAFRFSGDEEVRLITSRPAVRDYWRTRRREAERGSGKPPVAADDAPAVVEAGVPCMVTGVECRPVRLHPKIKGIPPLGDTKGGVQLTSVNQKSFESYGLEEFGCAPVSQRSADAYEKALNSLLANDLRHARLSFGSVVVFWSKGDAALVDLFSDAITEGNPDSIRALFGSPWRGGEIRLADGDVSPFYALTLSGAIGRGTVRAWHETTLGAVLTNLRHYFADLEVVRPPQDSGRPRPLLGLLRQLAVQGDLENIPPGLASELFAAVLGGRPFPRSVLDCALRRARAERTVYADRASLIKAYLCRARRAGDRSIPEVHPVLDEACPAPAYRLGRLFAVLEKVQEDAVGASATIRDRFYGAASATPVVVFPQLLRKLPHHLAKLEAATYFERIIQQISDGLQPPTPFPHVLTLEEQGLFAVGYFHQRQALFAKREPKPAQAPLAQSAPQENRP